MTGKTRRYEAADLVVEYEARRCIHAAECVKGLPVVFDPDRRPWIDPSQATVDEIVRTVEACPTGALTVQIQGQIPAANAPGGNEIHLQKDGPLFLRGNLQLNQTPELSVAENRIALCRCGASKNKPFCDNSHSEAEFRDDGNLGKNILSQEEQEGAILGVTPVKNGPVIIQGPVTLKDSTLTNSHEGSKGAVCRCGLSKNKPYCDGSHKPAGFQAD